MFVILLQMAALIAAGVAWRALRPAGVDAATSRRVLTSLVYYLLLPGLVLLVIWQAPLGLNSGRIALVAAVIVGLGLAASWLVCRLSHQNRATTGAILLAAAFPNVTYMGLPVLEKTFGPWARGIAIQYDLFACMPLVLTVGILIAQRYGNKNSRQNILIGLLRVPPLWAAVVGVGLNLGAVPLPAIIQGGLELLASAAVPLMLLAIGMGLRWERTLWTQLPAVLPVAAIRLLLMPLAALGLATGVGLSGELLAAVVLEAGMPSMLLGIVFSDRYGLNTTVYAAAVTVSTIVSLLTLPLWFAWLQPPLFAGLFG